MADNRFVYVAVASCVDREGHPWVQELDYADKIKNIKDLSKYKVKWPYGSSKHQFSVIDTTCSKVRRKISLEVKSW